METPGNHAVDSFFAAAPKDEDGNVKPSKRNPVIVVGTYSIGKERIVKGMYHFETSIMGPN
jgi:hypothetical protein